MKKGGGKIKGGTFEREVCKQLSLWWSEGLRGDIFWRTSGSGSRCTVRAKQDKQTVNSAGDVCYLDESGKELIDSYLIELKRGYNNEMSLNKLIDSGVANPMLISIWEKAKSEAKKSGRKYVILIYKRDRRKSMVVVSRVLFDILQRHRGQYEDVMIGYRKPPNSFIITPFEDFITHFAPEDLVLASGGGCFA